jgi:hypothetical protein
MSKVALLAALIIILGIGTYYFNRNKRTEIGEQDNFATWNEFIPRSNLFKVLLPHAPQYGKDFLAIPKSEKKRRFDMYISEKIDGSLFLISVITYPPDYAAPPSNEMMRQNIEELIQNKSDNKLTKISNRPFEGRNALDYTIESKDFHVAGRSIHDDHVVYMLTYITRNENFDQEEYEHFIQSFHLLNNGKGEKESSSFS